jgi:hypothetical protein
MIPAGCSRESRSSEEVVVRYKVGLEVVAQLEMTAAYPVCPSGRLHSGDPATPSPGYGGPIQPCARG